MSTIDDSYWCMFNAFRNRDNFMDVYVAILNTIGNEVNLVPVKSGLTLGPGEGTCEIEFIKKCTPNLAKLTAVELDHESVERLKNHLRNGLSNVEAQVIETSFSTWKGLDDPVDLVLMFHMIYYYEPDERKQLSKKLHDSWLAAGGFVVILLGGEKGNKIFGRLGKPLPMWEDLEAEFLEAGFIKQRVYETEYARDYLNPDDQFLRFYQYHAGRPVTLDDVRDAMKELYQEEKAHPTSDTLAVFQKAY